MNDILKTKKDNQAILANSAVLLPPITGDEAIKVWHQYQDLIQKVCTDEDYQLIEGKKFRKKSGWRKIATFFNLSVEVVEEKCEQIGKTFVWHFTCKAVASNRRFAIGTGSCDAFEKAELKDGRYVVAKKVWSDRYKKMVRAQDKEGNYIYDAAQPNSIHNIRSTAETRAFNRAVSNLVGGGEVSAEEVTATISGHPIEEVDVDAIAKAIK